VLAVAITRNRLAIRSQVENNGFRIFPNPRAKGATSMGVKLMRIATTSLMLLSLWPACDVLAASTDADQKMLDARQQFPANSFVVLEAQLFEGDDKTAKLCRAMSMTIKSGAGKSVTILTRELLLFDKANNKFGGAAVLPPGTYTVVQITCGSDRYRGSLARFTLQSPQSINLGCLIVEFRGSRSNPFVYPTYSGHSRVVDLSPNAVASLTKRVPVSFGATVKRFMTPILTDSNPKPAP
jgi:hypothetical protein